MKKKVIIVGAGGHGRVVADALLLSGAHEVAGFVDDQLAAGTIVIGDLKVLASSKAIDVIKREANAFVIAIGNNELRKKFFEQFSAFLEPASVIHPAASVSAFAKVGEGSQVLAGAVLGANAVIGRNCIINALSLVDHDSVVGDHVHVAQGALIGGGCKVEAGATIAQGQSISSYSTKTS